MARPPSSLPFPLRHLGGSYVHYDLSVRLHACSPPRLVATQLARSAVLNRLIAPAGLSPALICALRAHGFRERFADFGKVLNRGAAEPQPNRFGAVDGLIWNAEAQRHGAGGPQPNPF